MTFRPVHLLSLTALALVLCSCSESDKQSGRSQEAQRDDTSSPPNISPSAAPGVGFNYDYGFSVPDERIAATQEVHATTCEKLGLERCRITGITYSVDQNEQVIAELDLKLDPLIARQFGKSAQQSVEANDGKLFRLQISSSDEGQAIEQATKQKNDKTSQIAQLQQELAKTKAGTEARTNIISQIQALQQQTSDQSRSIETSQAALASTPMEIHYYGRGGVPGFRGNPVRAAWITFVATVVWLVKILLQVLAILIPLGVLIALLVAMWRSRPVRALRRWLASARETDG